MAGSAHRKHVTVSISFFFLSLALFLARFPENGQRAVKRNTLTSGWREFREEGGDEVADISYGRRKRKNRMTTTTTKMAGKEKNDESRLKECARNEMDEKW